MKKQKKSIAVLLSILFLVIVSISLSGCGFVFLKNENMKQGSIDKLVQKNKSLASYTKTVYKGLSDIFVKKNSNYELIGLSDVPLGGGSYYFGNNTVRLYKDYCMAINGDFKVTSNMDKYFNFFKSSPGYYTWGQFSCMSSSHSIIFALEILYNYIPVGNHVDVFYIMIAKPTIQYADKIKTDKIKTEKNSLKFYQGSLDFDNINLAAKLVPSNINAIQNNLIHPYGPKTPVIYTIANPNNRNRYNHLILSIINNSHSPFNLNLSQNKTVENSLTQNIYALLFINNKFKKSGSKCTLLNNNKVLLVNPGGNCSIAMKVRIPGFLFTINKIPLLKFGNLKFHLMPVSKFDLKDKGNN